MSVELDDSKHNLSDIAHNENCSPANPLLKLAKTPDKWLNSSNNVERSILKASNFHNLVQFRTTTKVDFRKPPVTAVPTVETQDNSLKEDPKFADIRQLDEEETWIERTSIITRTEHERYFVTAREIMSELIDNLPLKNTDSEAEAVTQELEPSLKSKPNVLEAVPELEVVHKACGSATTTVTVELGHQDSQTESCLTVDDKLSTFSNIKLKDSASEGTAEGTAVTPDKGIIEDIKKDTLDKIQGRMAESSVPSSPPLPRGGYNFNFDDFDENTNPFEIRQPQMQANVLNMDELPVSSPFQTKSKIAVSPPPLPPMVETNNNDSMSEPTSPIEKAISEVDRNEGGNEEIIEHTDISSCDNTEPINYDLEKESESVLIAETSEQHDPSWSGIIPQQYVVREDAHFTVKEELVTLDSGESESERFYTPPEELLKAEESEISAKSEFAMPQLPAPRKPVAKTQPAPTTEEDFGFKPAYEVFSDPLDLDMLDQFGSSDTGKESELSRLSLYVKFDPLVNKSSSLLTSQGRGAANLALKALQKQSCSDDLLLMNTPPHKTSSKVPDVKKEAASLNSSETTTSPPTDPFAFSPAEKSKYDDSIMDKSHIPAHILNGGMGSSCHDNIVEVLKYSESDVNTMKQQIELEAEAKILAKDRAWDKKLQKQGEMKADLQIQFSQRKADSEELLLMLKQAMSEKENTNQENMEATDDLIKERDQALEDLKIEEKNIADLYQKYLKIKELAAGFKKKEATLLQANTDLQSEMKAVRHNCYQLLAEAEDNVIKEKEKSEQLEQSTNSVMAKLKASLQKSELKRQAAESSLEQKITENQQISAICDELIAKVENKE